MDGADGHTALSYGWDDITLSSRPRADVDPQPWVSSVQPGDRPAAPAAGMGLLVAMLLAGVAGTLVGLLVLVS